MVARESVDNYINVVTCVCNYVHGWFTNLGLGLDGFKKYIFDMVASEFDSDSRKTFNVKWVITKRFLMLFSLCLFNLLTFFNILGWIGSTIKNKLRFLLFGCRCTGDIGHTVTHKTEHWVMRTTIEIKERRSKYLMFKIFLVFIWVFATYQSIHLQCCNVHFHETMDQPPAWQVQNCIADASFNQIFIMRSNVFLYACSKIFIKFVSRNSSFDDSLILLLSGDIEKNPGPENWYSLRHPNMCPFFRTAVYMVFDHKKLLPKSSDDFVEFVDIDDGFIELQDIFQQYFDAHLIVLKSLKKNILHFMNKNKDWGRNDSLSKNEYYSTFTPTIWVKLTEAEKLKHNLFCNECPKIHFELMAKFPSTSNAVHGARMKNPSQALKAAKKCLNLNKAGRATLKDTLNKVSMDLNTSFTNLWDVSFDESFQNHHDLVKKITPEEKRQLTKKHLRDAVNNINIDNNNTSVDRLYGARLSVRSWDRERKKKSFETVSEAKIRTNLNKENVEKGVKRDKDHVGSFASYQIDDALLKDAASWTAIDHINFTEIGKKYVRKDGNIPKNVGQITKLYLEDKENNEGFNFSYMGKYLK